jgi:hypothetical protein
MRLPNAIEDIARFDFLHAWRARKEDETNNTAIKKKTQVEERFCYVLIYFLSPEASQECIERLKLLTVECLTSASDCRAYATIRDDEELFKEVQRDPEVVHIEKSEPPAGK